MPDDRKPASGRVELSPSESLLDALLKEGYPFDEYPEVESAQDAFERAAADIIRQRRHGGMPPDIYQSLRSSAEHHDGFLPLLLSSGGDALIQPSENGGVRISTVREAAPETATGAAAVMDFTELSDDELFAETKHLDGEDIAAWTLRLARLRPDLDVEEMLALTWALSDVALADAFAYMMREGCVEPDALVAAAEEARDRVEGD